MKLPAEFCRLPVRFDSDRMKREVLALPEAAWRKHPTGYPGNSAVRLISSDGQENDDLGGTMAETPHLKSCPYIRQVLASFGVAWSRSRLMLLAPGGQVPQHCDINYHWHRRVRMHIPVITFPEVRFHCGGVEVHMDEGEAWLFDNWRPHKVLNPTPHARIHLVADTVGSGPFWALAQRGQWNHASRAAPGHATPLTATDADTLLLTERHNTQLVMPPAEIEMLLGDLVVDLAGSQPQIQRTAQMLNSFTRQWRHLWSLHGQDVEGWAAFEQLRDSIRHDLQQESADLMMRSNQISALQVIDARVLRHVVNRPGKEAFRKPEMADR